MRIVYFKRCLLFLVALSLWSSCRVQEKCIPHSKESNLTEEVKGPKRQYVPEYYHYRNGKYHFVEGHYSWVLFPKKYARRSLRGFGYKQRYAAGPRPRNGG